MGSVKDLELIKKPTEDSMGLARFVFSDRYSVFDWGEMPDHIEGKGAALCLIGAYCFEMLQAKQIRTHYQGIIGSDEELVTVKELNEPTNTMQISLVNVYPPTFDAKKKAYDYRYYSRRLKNYLLPLEIIYRNSLPEGASVFKRLKEGKTSLRQLGLDHCPQPGEKLLTPIFEVSTKLEQTDRYVDWQEGQDISGMSEKDVGFAKQILLKVDGIVSMIAEKAGLVNEDGKIELAYDPRRRLMIVDVVGTLDECRFTYGGLHVSKEITRQFYRDTDWYRDVEEAKRRAEEEGISDWKSLCESSPPKLPVGLKKIVSQMYMAAANSMTGTRKFDVPSLADVVEEYRGYAGEKR